MFPHNREEERTWARGLRRGREGAKRPRAAVALLALVQAAACAAPGVPLPPHAPVPAAITDLAAKQTGDAVVLTFTLPTKREGGEHLEAPPEIQILREFEAKGTSEPKAPATVAYTIPPSQTAGYVTEGKMTFQDSLSAEQMQRAASGKMVYAVRSSVNGRVASQLSNLAVVEVGAAAAPIGDLRAEVRRKEIELKWTAPVETADGEPMPAMGGYHVYRGEVAMGMEAAAEANPREAKLEGSVGLLGVAAATSYNDAAFEFGRAYVYRVRSVAEDVAGDVESADSNVILVWAKDVFAPGAPQGLAAVPVQASAGVAAHIELSWDVNTETDLGGYNVYRKESASAPWKRVNADLLPVPVFRDMSAETGRGYVYAVTAVSRAGMESERSAEAAATLPPQEGTQP